MEGDPIQLDGSVPALRPCRKCGGAEGRLTAPKGPHNNGVRCADCGLHLGWLPVIRDDTDLIED